MAYVTGTPQNPTDSARQGLAPAIAQAVTAQAASHGLPFVPASMADAIAAQAINDLNARPAGQLRGMSLADGTLMSVVAASFSAALSQLSEPQQRALKMGLDPFNAAVVSGLVLAAAAGRGRRGHAEDEPAETRSSRRFASLRDRDDECSEKARQFSGLGFGGATMDSLSALQVDRKFVERLLLLGYSSLHIADVARDAQALGLKGEREFAIANAAPTDLRSAAAAIANGRTEAERVAAEKHYRELVERYQHLPDDDPRRHATTDFIRLKQQMDEMKAQRLRIGDHATQALSTEEFRAIVNKSGNNPAQTQADRAERSARRTSETLADAQADDAFKVTVTAGSSAPRPPAPS